MYGRETGGHLTSQSGEAGAARGRASRKGPSGNNLLQLHRPIRRIQELLPALVTFVGEADVDDGAALGLDRLGDQVHVGLLGGATALFHVALDAAADDVLPRAAAALALGRDVVERELGGGELLAAVLAAAGVAGVDVAAVELHVLPRELFVPEQADDARHGDLEANRVDPVELIRLEL